MKKYNLKSLLLFGSLATIGFLSCEKKNTYPTEPTLPAGSNPAIYGSNYFESYLDGVRWFGKKGVMYVNHSGWSHGSTNKDFSLYIELGNDNDSTGRKINVDFTTNEPIIPGVYSTTNGKMNNFSAKLWRKLSRTSSQGFATFDASKGDWFSITIDSSYAQHSNVLYFGKIEGEITRDNSTTKIAITNGNFGYVRN